MGMIMTTILKRTMMMSDDHVVEDVDNVDDDNLP